MECGGRSHVLDFSTKPYGKINFPEPFLRRFCRPPEGLPPDLGGSSFQYKNGKSGLVPNRTTVSGQLPTNEGKHCHPGPKNRRMADPKKKIVEKV